MVSTCHSLLAQQQCGSAPCRFNSQSELPEAGCAELGAAQPVAVVTADRRSPAAPAAVAVPRGHRSKTRHAAAAAAAKPGPEQADGGQKAPRWVIARNHLCNIQACAEQVFRAVDRLDVASELRWLQNRQEDAAEDDTQGAASSRVFLRRRPRANRQCLVSQPEDGTDEAEVGAHDAAPAGPDTAHASRADAPHRGAVRTGRGVQLVPKPAALLPGVPALGCSKCRMAKRGCGKCRHDRWTALKVSVSMLTAAALSRVQQLVLQPTAQRLRTIGSPVTVHMPTCVIKSQVERLVFFLCRLSDLTSWRCSAIWSLT